MIYTTQPWEIPFQCITRSRTARFCFWKKQNLQGTWWPAALKLHQDVRDNPSVEKTPDHPSVEKTPSPPPFFIFYFFNSFNLVPEQCLLWWVLGLQWTRKAEARITFQRSPSTNLFPLQAEEKNGLTIALVWISAASSNVALGEKEREREKKKSQCPKDIWPLFNPFSVLRGRIHVGRVRGQPILPSRKRPLGQYSWRQGRLPSS